MVDAEMEPLEEIADLMADGFEIGTIASTTEAVLVTMTRRDERREVRFDRQAATALLGAAAPRLDPVPV